MPANLENSAVATGLESESEVAQSCPTLCDPWTLAHQAPPSMGFSRQEYWSRVPLDWKRSGHTRSVGDAIQLSVIPFSSCPKSLPASKSFPMSQLFAWGSQSTGVSALGSFLPKNTQDWSPLNGLVGSPCSPRDSQESSPTPQFKSINSSALSFLHSPTLTSIHNHWKNHSLD